VAHWHFTSLKPLAAFSVPVCVWLSVELPVLWGALRAATRPEPRRTPPQLEVQIHWHYQWQVGSDSVSGLSSSKSHVLPTEYYIGPLQEPCSFNTVPAPCNSCVHCPPKILILQSFERSSNAIKHEDTRNWKVLLGNQLNGLLRCNSSHDGRHRMQLCCIIATPA